jgi:VanZ family protein
MLTEKWQFPLALAYASTVAIVVVSLVPVQLRPHLFAISQFDHFGSYLATGIAFAFAFKRFSNLVAAIVFLAVLAGLLEIAQHWIPGRTPRVSDWVASSLGAFVGLAFVLSIRWTTTAVQRSVTNNGS